MNRTLDGDIQYHDGEIGISQCVWCRHREPGGRRCRAFPDGIPPAIAVNRHDHREPYDGDRGVRFEPEVIDIEFIEVEDETDPPPVAPARPRTKAAAAERASTRADRPATGDEAAENELLIDLDSLLGS